MPGTALHLFGRFEVSFDRSFRFEPGSFHALRVPWQPQGPFGSSEGPFGNSGSFPELPLCPLVALFPRLRKGGPADSVTLTNWFAPLPIRKYLPPPLDTGIFGIRLKRRGLMRAVPVSRFHERNSFFF